MCHLGLISLSMRKPNTQTGNRSNKKRNVNGTITSHYLDYLTKLLKKLVLLGLQGYLIIMDNASIHKAPEIRELILNGGYKCVFLPTYSPFLNPIRELWSKVTYCVKRTPFETGDTLTPRIIEAGKQVTQEDWQGWTRHSVSKFEDCLNKVPM